MGVGRTTHSRIPDLDHADCFIQDADVNSFNASSYPSVLDIVGIPVQDSRVDLYVEVADYLWNRHATY
jgi:hypothetical protein